MSQYVCSACQYRAFSWFGRCPQCQEWNTLIEKETVSRSSNTKPAIFTSLSDVAHASKQRITTAFGEFDRVLGGGYVKGGIVLISGEPGVGKSSLILKAVEGKRVLYMSGEESGSQLRGRASRLNVKIEKIDFTDNANINAILSNLISQKNTYEIIVLDSIQTAYCDDVPSTAGSITQIKEVLLRMGKYVKERNCALTIVGHITKGGEIAGPKSLEHMVDVVLYLEGEKNSQLRLLRAYKNRYGETDEVGVFEMTQSGLKGLKSVTHVLSSSSTHAPGKATVGVPEGSRVLFYEVQTLTVPSFLASPRRVVSGIGYNRLQLLLAVAQKHIGTPFDKVDVFTNVVGGVSITSPASDLGIVASAVSAIKNKSLRVSSVYIGEVGLLGEVRKIYKQEKCIAEAQRYNFDHIISSEKINSIRSLSEYLDK